MFLDNEIYVYAKSAELYPLTDSKCFFVTYRHIIIVSTYIKFHYLALTKPLNKASGCHRPNVNTRSYLYHIPPNDYRNLMSMKSPRRSMNKSLNQSGFTIALMDIYSY